jgi:hypothetical protein
MSLREQLIEEAEAYSRDGISLPLDLISSLMQQGIDHRPYNVNYRDAEPSDADIHNVD